MCSTPPAAARRPVSLWLDGDAAPLTERVLIYQMLGDDRAVEATYLLGERVQVPRDVIA